MQNKSTKNGKIIDIVNENGVSKTVIEFEDFDSLEKGIRKMLSFSGYEDCSFYIHQHVNREKLKNKPAREIGSVNSIFRGGFSFNSYKGLGQTACRMGVKDLYVGTNNLHDEKWNKINTKRDEIRQDKNKNFADLLTFDAINYDYEGYMSDENCVTIIAIPKYINLDKNKKVQFGLDYDYTEGCYYEKSEIPYVEMQENSLLSNIMSEKYKDRSAAFVKKYCENIAKGMGVPVSDVETLAMKDLFRLDINKFFESNKYLSDEVLDKAFEESYLKDGKVFFENDFKTSLKDSLDFEIRRTIFPSHQKPFSTLVEETANHIIRTQQGEAEANKHFVLGTIAFGSEEYGFKPLIVSNNAFYAYMDKESQNDFFGTFKTGAIKFADIDLEKDSQEDIDRKVENKTKESYKGKDQKGAFREGSYLSDFDFD